MAATRNGALSGKRTIYGRNRGGTARHGEEGSPTADKACDRQSRLVSSDDGVGGL
jgi:hypothetical protein